VNKDFKVNTGMNFGKRLSELRKARRITQKELADKVGTSQRMIAYYEGPANYIPVNLLPTIARILKTSTDELLGIKQLKDNFIPENAKLWRKLRDVEELSAKDQKALIHYLEALLAKNKKT
jgi:transcriptional regulator with XRE-family HTH domain